MKHLHTKISLYRPVLFIIWGPRPYKRLNLDPKRWSRDVKFWPLLSISGFWQFNMAYEILFCCQLYHLSEWMQEKGHWGDLWAIIVPQKALISFKNSNISWYIEQQKLIINVLTQTTKCTVIMKPLHTRISLYRPVPFIIGGPKPFKYMRTSWSIETMVYKWNKNKALPVYTFDFDAHLKRKLIWTGHLVFHNKFPTKIMKALNIFGVTNGPLLVMNEQKHI